MVLILVTVYLLAGLWFACRFHQPGLRIEESVILFLLRIVLWPLIFVGTIL